MVLTNAVIELSQASGELHIGAPVAPDVEVASGFGGWTLVREGSVVSSANVQGAGEEPEPRYTVDEGTDTEYLGRDATLYRMTGDGVVRGELVFDVEAGALLRVVTFNADGSVFCERRFVTFEPGTPPATDAEAVPSVESAEGGVESNLPETLGNFDRLDVYQDEEGFIFAYYSDGFFSFAVFQTPAIVAAGSGSLVTIGERTYIRSSGAGHVTYAWETSSEAWRWSGTCPPTCTKTCSPVFRPPRTQVCSDGCGGICSARLVRPGLCDDRSETLGHSAVLCSITRVFGLAIGQKARLANHTNTSTGPVADAPGAAEHCSMSAESSSLGHCLLPQIRVTVLKVATTAPRLSPRMPTPATRP